MKYLLIAFFGFAISLPVAAQERIIDTSNGREITRDELVNILSEKQFILLGELHDNAMHHQHRGELLLALEKLSPTVIAEHLDQGKKVIISGNLLSDLEAAGFNAKGWRWPLHESLFQAVIASGTPLIGGNISRETARKAVREGESALPDDLVQLIKQAPLSEEAQSALNADLLRGHCGQLPDNMLEGLRLAQRARDAAMFGTLRLYQKDPAPVILVAGNGHVRLDYGVPSLIRQHLPDASYASIGFLEEGASQPGSSKYDYLWVTETIQRDDPCTSFKTSQTMKSAV